MVLSLFSFTSAARAEEVPAHVASSNEASPGDVRVVTGLGVFGAKEGAGLAIDGALLARKGIFEGGAIAQAGSGLGISRYVSLGGAAGVGLAPSAKWRVDLLGTAGVDLYSGFGTSALSEDPGATGTSPFVGGRVGVTHRWSVFELGALANVASDVAPEHVSYSYLDHGWFGGTSQLSRERDVGTTRYSLMLTLGAGWDL